MNFCHVANRGFILLARGCVENEETTLLGSVLDQKHASLAHVSSAVKNLTLYHVIKLVIFVREIVIKG